MPPFGVLGEKNRNGIFFATISPPKKISPQRHREHGEKQRKDRIFLSFRLSLPLCVSARKYLFSPSGRRG
jgi:hypothetical protein